jgi:hypothetical protein
MVKKAKNSRLLPEKLNFISQAKMDEELILM